MAIRSTVLSRTRNNFSLGNSGLNLKNITLAISIKKILVLSLPIKSSFKRFFEKVK